MADDINKKNSIDVEINTNGQQQIDQYKICQIQAKTYAKWHTFSSTKAILICILSLGVKKKSKELAVCGNGNYRFLRDIIIINKFSEGVS